MGREARARQARRVAAELPVYYHYTLPDYLPSILAEGIRPAIAFVPKNERPVVWLTASEVFEPTALKAVLTQEGERLCALGLPIDLASDEHTHRMTLEDQIQRGVGAARVEVGEEAARLTWWDWLQKSGVQKKVARGLRLIAEKRGSNVNQWRASFEVIGPEHFVGIDVWHAGGWLRVVQRDADRELVAMVGGPSPFQRRDDAIKQATEA